MKKMRQITRKMGIIMTNKNTFMKKIKKMMKLILI